MNTKKISNISFYLLIPLLLAGYFPPHALGQFEEADPGITPAQDPSIAAVDFDSDGLDEIGLTGRAGIGSYIATVYQNSEGNFSVYQEELPGVSGGNLAWGDYDDDGDLDLVSTGWDAEDNATATIYEHDDESFTAIDAGLEGIVKGGAAWGDFDNDGDLDLAVVGTNDVLQPTATLYENEGNNNFSKVGARLRGVTDGSVKWADVNQDDLPDLIITGKDRENFPIAVIYLNEGDGNFSQMETDLMGVFGDTSVDWGDYNEDGYPDLVVTGWNANMEPTTVVYKNYEGDSLASIGERFMGVSDGEAEWVDYNQNGSLELFVTGMNANNTIVARFYQIESDTITARMQPDNIQGLWKSSIEFANFDGNKYPDLIMSGINEKNEAKVKYYKNDGKDSDGNFGNWLFE